MGILFHLQVTNLFVTIENVELFVIFIKKNTRHFLVS
jgi:hypothetical protein